MDPYGYCYNNPINLIGPDGKLPIIPIIWGGAIEVGGAIYDGYQAYKTLSDKNATTGEKWAAAGGVALGAVLPGAGYGTGAKSAVKVINREALERGVKNESKTIVKEGLTKNTKTFTAIDPKTKKPVNIKPDAIDSEKVTEIKDVKTLSNTKQIRGERELAKRQGKNI